MEVPSAKKAPETRNKKKEADESVVDTRAPPRICAASWLCVLNLPKSVVAGVERFVCGARHTPTEELSWEERADVW